MADDDGPAVADDGSSGTDEGGTGAGDGTVLCPACGESLPAGARFCPACATAIDESGDAVDLADLDGFPMDDPPDLLEVEDGERRASGRVRALTGLAVAIPLAPLALFLVNSVVPQTVWTAPVVFLTAWLVCGAVLSRARVPVEAFGRSLYLLALGTALVPVALLVGDSGVADDPATTPFRVVAVGAMVIAGVFLLLGRYVTLQGRRRVSGERRAFEDARE